ncbi:MAG: site-specific DNA-methyltransferase [Eubacteriaceae bacterium]|jgi:adenine-specific DNA-methyltransferase|nr:site-specific DNA-methyltransferase [Eubacteriaceae bacterium]
MNHPDKLAMRTTSLADKNFAALSALFPNAVTEAVDENGTVVRAIDKDVLTQEINAHIVEGSEERYQFTWPGKRNSILLANMPIAAVLRPCREESVNFDTTENLYIEGDNLDVLKVLRETYLKSVKMIYIDPPYNTGNDFVYKDNFAKSASEHARQSGGDGNQGSLLGKNFESSGRFHTAWLNMIYPRLRLARDLLTDDGVIFISIGENEITNMQLLCNEIFGEQNYAATFIWTKTSTPPSLARKCRKTVEYVLAYEKRWSAQKYFGSFIDNGDAPLLNTGNPFKTLTFPKGSVRFGYIENGLIAPGKKDRVALEDEINVIDSINANSFRLNGEFKWTQETLNGEVASGTYFIVKTKKFSIRFQRVGNEGSYKAPTNFINVELNTESAAGTNESAVKELESLQLGSYFDYPKPTTLIKALISMVCNFDKDSLILDFFSGSATTAHAVMQLNAEDGGKRKFIMVQLPEVCNDRTAAKKAGYSTICDIGKERIRRAGAKIKADRALATESLDIGFRVLKLDIHM